MEWVVGGGCGSHSLGEGGPTEPDFVRLFPQPWRVRPRVENDARPPGLLPARRQHHHVRLLVDVFGALLCTAFANFFLIIKTWQTAADVYCCIAEQFHHASFAPLIPCFSLSRARRRRLLTRLKVSFCGVAQPALGVYLQRNLAPLQRA